MTTAYITHPRYTEHHLAGHPEHAGRIRAVWAALDSAGLSTRMQKLDAPAAAEEWILSVHTPKYLELLAGALHSMSYRARNFLAQCGL